MFELMKTFEMGEVSQSSLEAYDSETLIMTKSDIIKFKEVKNILNMSNQKSWNGAKKVAILEGETSEPILRLPKTKLVSW